MSRFFMVFLILTVLVYGTSNADQPRPDLLRASRVIHGGIVETAKIPGDTINLMGMHGDPTNGPGEPHYYGDFQDAAGDPAWNGWTHRDASQETEHHWQVSNFGQTDPGNLAAWCGDINIASCDDSLDPPGGYGNAWDEVLEFRIAAPDPASLATVTVTATLQIDTEPTYDYVFFSRPTNAGGPIDLGIWDGFSVIDLDEAMVFTPADYLSGTDIALQFRFTSDGGWSDADCSYPTIRGALQVDDIAVQLTNGAHELDFFTDFQDGTFGDWAPTFPPGVGDFAQLWTGLRDIDVCAENWTPQVAFIDDGQVVPGTGGTQCIEWCYGPYGFIVNNTGGLAGPEKRLYNLIESPVMDWPDDVYDGILIEWELYSHAPLTNDDPGLHHMWGVRSADTDGSAGHGVQNIEDQPWLDRGFIYGPWKGRYVGLGNTVTDLMNAGRDVFQVQHSLYEVGWIWGWDGQNGTPAPYYDNIKVQVYDHAGPAMSAREMDLANDGFPERGSIDFEDLGSHSVRFDMSRDIALSSHMHLDYGDSIVADIVPVRHGAALHETPELYYRIWRNPVFNPYRTAGLPDEGAVPGFPTLGASGIWNRETWAFDLPDTGFLFPGDVLHYFLRAQDSVDGADIRTTIMPADTTGFSAPFHIHQPYDDAFAVRALPSIHFDGVEYSTPPILAWLDHGDRGARDRWMHSLPLATEGFPGQEYDIFYTNGARSGVGNGLGGKAGTAHNLRTYRDIYYTCGDLSYYTISNGDFGGDSSDDIGILNDWLALGDKDIFLTGDDLVTSLLDAGPAGLAFATDVLGVSLHQSDIRPLIENQRSPLVEASAGHPLFWSVVWWTPFGGCPDLRTFDAVVPTASAQRIAEFTDLTGQVGAYPYSAMTLHQPAGTTNRVLSLPYDLAHIQTPNFDKAGGPPAARLALLRDVTRFFGNILYGHPGSAVPGLVFSARNHPNPFNPVTKIVYTVPRAGHLSLKIYDIRGRLVRTLVDDRVEAGADQVATWDGRNDAGAAVSSGVYFYEARTGSEVKVGKMALVK